MKNDFSIYVPFFDLIGVPVIYEGELYGLSHEEAEKKYKERLKEGFYDDDDE